MPICTECGTYYLKGKCPKCFPAAVDADVWHEETAALEEGALVKEKAAEKAARQKAEAAVRAAAEAEAAKERAA